MRADVLVVLDFHDANQTLRNAFARSFHESGWRHHPSMANSFYKRDLLASSDDELTELCEDCVRQSAAGIGLERWDATCILGEPGWPIFGTDQVDPFKTDSAVTF